MLTGRCWRWRNRGRPLIYVHHATVDQGIITFTFCFLAGWLVLLFPVWFCFVFFYPNAFFSLSDCTCHRAPPSVRRYLEHRNTPAASSEGRKGNTRETLAARLPIKCPVVQQSKALWAWQRSTWTENMSDLGTTLRRQAYDAAGLFWGLSSLVVFNI